MITMTILIVGTLLISAILAGWPLLLSRALRPAVQGAGGSLCLLAGGGAFFMLVSGLTGATGETAIAQAAESSGSVTAKGNDETAFFTKADATPLNTPIQSSVDEVRIIGNAPAWVGSQPVRDGSIHTVAVSSDPYSTDLEAEKALDTQLEQETADYIQWVLGSSLAPRFIHYSAEEIKREHTSVDKTYVDQVETPTVGMMHRRHVLLEFKPEFRIQLQQQWNEIKAKWRLAQFGLVAGGAILLLATVFGYFRLDTATRGYYTGRLQFLSAAAILAIVGAGVVLARWIAWL